MPAPSTPSSTRGSFLRGRASYANPNMRVSDAERAEVADRLSHHYGEGRLDQEEFSRRLDQAMNATTQSDLAGLFADLPGTEPPGPGPAGAGRPRRGDLADAGAPPSVGPRPPRRRYPRLLAIVLIIVVTAAVGHALAHLVLPVVLIVVLALAWLRFGPGRRGRRSVGG